MGRENIKLRITDILQSEGIDYKTLAERVGKAPTYINNVIHGRDMSLNILADIAAALGVEFGDLFVSSFSPVGTGGDFSAVVRCGESVFCAGNIAELGAVVDRIRNLPDSAENLMRRTLERMLRFPNRKDYPTVSELMVNLSRCMPPEDWRKYYKDTLLRILPSDFRIDYRHLSGFMDGDGILEFERSII